MKRIQSACLEQTIRFVMKDDIPREEARQMVQAEYRHYLEQMDRNRTGYKVLEELPQTDGSLIVRLKRQYNNYDVGDYLR
ncbi:hypothetical protein [Dysosmobacter sp. HCP28S3_G4]|uniref:hypothetical protein n=1 Tax=Dysosmobacter sp. HCP28S3_G4 TaxID=3438938 RepID=UPI003F894650